MCLHLKIINNITWYKVESKNQMSFSSWLITFSLYRSPCWCYHLCHDLKNWWNYFGKVKRDGKIRVSHWDLCDYGSRKSIIYVHVDKKQNKNIIICLLYVFIYISVMKTTATPETAKSGSLREHMINFQMSNYYSKDFSSSERLP